jgi:hypothetical protein
MEVLITEETRNELLEFLSGRNMTDIFQPADLADLIHQNVYRVTIEEA